jgi:DNA-binding response OmpR family regulator
VFQIGRYIHDSKNLKLTIDDFQQELTHRESDLLAFLIQHKNETLSRDKILIPIWGD